MRLLVLSQYFYPEIFRINDLVQELVTRGHKVTVLTGLPNYPNGNIYESYKTDPSVFSEYKGAKVIRVPMLPRGNASGLRLFFNYLSFAFMASFYGAWKLRGQDYDAIFVCQLSPVTVGLPAVLLRYLKRVPMTFWVQDLWPDTLAALGILNSRFGLALVGIVVRFIYKYSDLILVQSKGFVAGVEKYVSNKKKIAYFPNWAESALEIDGVNPAPEIPMNNLGIFRIIFTGNIGDAQDFPAVIEAANILKNYSMIKWYIIGQGSMSKWVEERISSLGLGKNVLMLGQFPLERMPSFYKCANILLVSLQDRPIFSMTIPSKVQAYLASGRPIVGMIGGEGAEVIKHSQSGFVCQPGDYKNLAQLILKLSDMPREMLLQMGKDGRNYGQEHFDRDRLVSRLEKYLSEVKFGDNKKSQYEESTQ